MAAELAAHHAQYLGFPRHCRRAKRSVRLARECQSVASQVDLCG